MSAALDPGSAAAGASAARRVRPLLGLLPLMARYPGLLLGWGLSLLVSSAAALTVPYAVRQMIDNGFSAANAQTIDQYFVGMIALALVLALATALRYYFISWLGERVVADMRRKLYAHLLDLDLAFFESTRTGELQSRLGTDTELVQTVVGSSASVAVRSVVTLVGATTLLVLTSPRLAGLASLVIPVVVAPMLVFGRRVRKLSRSSQDRIADIGAQASETLNAIQTVQAYAREPYERERYGSALARVLQTARQRIRTRSLLTAFVIVLVFGAVTAVMWAGARSVIEGTLTGGVLGSFVLYGVMAAGSFGALVEVLGELQRAAGAMERIGELMTTKPAIREPEHPASLVLPVRGVIRFDDVRFHYPSRPKQAALDQLRFEVRPGETVALVGPSGAGKSTVFQLLLRFYDPQSGQVTLDGRALRDLPLGLIRAHMALVPQDGVIFGTSAADNIRYARPEASLAEVEAAARAAEAHEFISELPEGYHTYLGERGVRLSGGQQQRIVIARALLKDAPILLLDEATSALDAQSEALVQAALERLMQGRTTLVIAHRLATVQRAHRIVVLQHGRIRAMGTHAELVAQGGLYAELARLQFAG